MRHRPQRFGAVLKAKLPHPPPLSPLPLAGPRPHQSPQQLRSSGLVAGRSGPSMSRAASRVIGLLLRPAPHAAARSPWLGFRGARPARALSAGAGEDHTSKWMSRYDVKTPQELIAQVPPIEVGARIVACEGGRDPSLGHPVEYICLDLAEPAVCKYCGLRYVQGSHHH